jgi:hypothetical protein
LTFLGRTVQKRQIVVSGLLSQEVRFVRLFDSFGVYRVPRGCCTLFCNVWVFLNNCLGVRVICVLVFTVFCVVSFMYVYSYLFCLYWCKDYCNRMKTHLQ